MPVPACPRHQTPPRSASGAAGDSDRSWWGVVQLQLADAKAQGPPPSTDSGRGVVTDQPPPRVPAETLARPELRGAHEPGTPNFGPRETMPKPRPATYGSISEPRVPNPRQSSPGVPPQPPARPSSRPRKTHQSATARSRARKRRTRGAGQPPAALALDTCHVGRRPG